jgi:hypothetical protein
MMGMLLRVCGLCVSVAAVAASCATGGQTGSETNWFATCRTEGDCRGGLQCLCGLCTRACRNGSVCGQTEELGCGEAEASTDGPDARPPTPPMRDAQSETVAPSMEAGRATPIPDSASATDAAAPDAMAADGDVDAGLVTTDFIAAATETVRYQPHLDPKPLADMVVAGAMQVTCSQFAPDDIEHRRGVMAFTTSALPRGSEVIEARLMFTSEQGTTIALPAQFIPLEMSYFVGSPPVVAGDYAADATPIWVASLPDHGELLPDGGVSLPEFAFDPDITDFVRDEIERGNDLKFRIQPKDEATCDFGIEFYTAAYGRPPHLLVRTRRR